MVNQRVTQWVQLVEFINILQHLRFTFPSSLKSLGHFGLNMTGMLTQWSSTRTAILDQMENPMWLPEVYNVVWLEKLFLILNCFMGLIIGFSFIKIIILLLIRILTWLNFNFIIYIGILIKYLLVRNCIVNWIFSITWPRNISWMVLYKNCNYVQIRNSTWPSLLDLV